jgi:hypothetical protein
LKSAVAQAVAHANEIVQSLQQALDQMEEVLELVELADRQKIADEREIESLRRSLRQIQRPRRERDDHGPHPDERRRDRRPEPQPEEHHAEPPSDEAEGGS